MRGRGRTGNTRKRGRIGPYCTLDDTAAPLPDDTPPLHVTYRRRCRNETYTLAIGGFTHSRSSARREPWVIVNERARARLHAHTRDAKWRSQGRRSAVTVILGFTSRGARYKSQCGCEKRRRVETEKNSERKEAARGRGGRTERMTRILFPSRLTSHIRRRIAGRRRGMYPVSRPVLVNLAALSSASYADRCR